MTVGVGVTDGVGVTVGDGVTVFVGVILGVKEIVGVIDGVGVGETAVIEIQNSHSVEFIITSNGHVVSQSNTLKISQLFASIIFKMTCDAPTKIDGNKNVNVGVVVLPVPIKVQLFKSNPHI